MTDRTSSAVPLPHAARVSGIDSGVLRERHDLSLIYGCDLAQLAPAYRSKFVQLGPDPALLSYLEKSQAGRHGRWLTWFHRLLRHVMSDFDINGLLGTYPMHVLSREQLSCLLEYAMQPGRQSTPGRLLDVGAGNGDVTETIAPLFSKVVTTETSWTMARSLRRKGFACHRVDAAQEGVSDPPYDVITCLNVLDRCDHPLKLLAALRVAMAPGGLLVVALVVPYSPFIYEGSTTRDPSERLPLSADRWEVNVNELCHAVLEPLGLSIQVIARVPYLSQGDAKRPHYELDDLIVVCRAEGSPLLIDGQS